MLKIGYLPIFILVINIGAFYGWSIIFSENEAIKLLGINALQIIAGTLSFILLFKGYRSINNGQKNFWLLLSMGMLFYLISNMIVFYFQIKEGDILFTDTSYVIWLLSYIFFLAALVFKTREISTAVLKSSYLFNIIIFMSTVTAISIHFLIKPILAISDNSLLITVFTIAYPITGLSTLFVITILYYLMQYSKEKELMLFIIIGFLLQIAADSVFAYLDLVGSYHPGNTIDLLWIVATLLIGFAGFYANGNKEESKWDIKNTYEKKEAIFPYVSIVILLFLTIYSYRWELNALSAGLLIIFLMIIGRQLIIMNKNNKLIGEYRYLAYHDPLTGLNNRASFKECLGNIMEKHHNRVALILIDLDRFKVVNDTLGHSIGDYILINTSERLKRALGTDAAIFRIGGDEFVIILPEATEKECSKVAEMILRKFQKPFLVDDYEIIVTPSIGISKLPENGGNGEDLFKHADAAMYLAKESGKNSFRFYNAELNKTKARKMKIENELRKAIEKNQISLLYQPKVDLYTRKIIGMEALLRWEHPELGWVPPIEFVPIAEETGQIVSIGEWVLRTACKQNKIWQEKGYSPLCVSVNVSARQFQQSGFLMIIRNILLEERLNPKFLELEITESIMHNIRESTEMLHSLRKMGVKTAIDDFGTGYSSLHIIQELPIDTIKIDKSFIDDIGNMSRQSMVKTIIELGLNLNLNVVAEGIENEHQLKVLLANKCKIGQGYLFSKALESKELERLLMIS